MFFRATNKERVDERQRKVIETGLIVEEAKQELIEKEWKGNLKDYLSDKLKELEEKIEDTRGELNPIIVNSYLRHRSGFGATPKYSPDELAIAFEYYQQFIETINTRVVYPPTKKNFCSLLGISSNIYDSYRESDIPDMQEIMARIDDYITDNALALAQIGKLKEITTIYRTKAENKMMEAQAPIVVKRENTVDLDDILRKVKAIKSGDTIELKENQRGEYE